MKFEYLPVAVTDAVTVPWGSQTPQLTVAELAGDPNGRMMSPGPSSASFRILMFSHTRAAHMMKVKGKR